MRMRAGFLKQQAPTVDARFMADGPSKTHAAGPTAPIAPSTGGGLITRSLLMDLAIAMTLMGLATGIVFPFFVVLLGVQAGAALQPTFFAATLGAGLLVGLANAFLSRTVVGRRLRLLSGHMRQVSGKVRERTVRGDWSGFDANECRLAIDSDDELGESAVAFNQLVDAMACLHRAEVELAESREQARTDELTGLGNLRQFQEMVDNELRTPPNGRERVLILLDVDSFKEINDVFGHAIGDALLRELGGRLAAKLSGARGLARIGGDEFAALIDCPGNGDEVAHCKRTLLEGMERPFDLGGLLVHVGISVGIADITEECLDRATLMRRADIAMYRAKKAGGGFARYVPGDDDELRDRLLLAGELPVAIENGQIVLHFQPKVSSRNGSVSSVEALARWEHPSRGLLPPSVFLPLAQQHGLMRALTMRVLGDAFAQADRWMLDGTPLRIAVNLGAANLMDASFPDEVAALIARTGASPQLLQLEITEDTIMADSPRVLDVLERLGELGFSFSLDDFGTGHSSLAHIRHLPVNEVKIDRSFIGRLDRDEDDRTIVRWTVELARSLGLNVVAEGVEHAGVWDRLVEMGCDSAQGFLFAPALAPGDLEAWLVRHRLSETTSAALAQAAATEDRAIGPG